MNLETTRNLENLAQLRKVRVHDPFAEYLHAQPLMHSFEISLLDCYRMSGHACHAITGAFLMTEAAVSKLFPETNLCERGDISVHFGSQLDERASGPRSNVISFITGAWGPTGFPGLKGNFRRKDLISYGHPEIDPGTIRFHRLSMGKSIDISFDPSEVINSLSHNLEFPEKWRAEICAILTSPLSVLKFSTPSL